MAPERAIVVLADAVRALMDASVLTTADDATRLAAASELRATADRLAAGGLRTTMLRPEDDGMRRGERPYSPVIGVANPIAPPLTVRILDDQSVVGECTLRAIHEGPPDAVHGGWVATVIDQVLGHATAAAGVPGFTAELTIRYRRPTPYNEPLVIRARTDSVDGRRVHASAELLAGDVVRAEATALFLRPSAERLEQLRGSVTARS